MLYQLSYHREPQRRPPDTTKEPEVVNDFDAPVRGNLTAHDCGPLKHDEEDEPTVLPAALGRR